MSFRNLDGELNMYRDRRIKPNFSEIARRNGVDRHTVARHWRAGEGAVDGRTERASGFDRYREEVEARAALPGVTKRGAHEWLLDRHGDEDPALPGYSAFTEWTRASGIEFGAGGREPHPRFETAPGAQLQFDWKEDIAMRSRTGELFEFNVFSATLGYSRRHLFRRSATRTTDDLLVCALSTMVRLGGTPREWLTDNMSALVVVGADGRRHRVERAWDFAEEAGFRLVLCAPDTPMTKGKVESSNRFLGRLRAYEGDFDTWEDLDRAIARIESRSNSEPSEETGLPPDVLFMREKDELLPLGNVARLQALVGDVTYWRVDSTMLVKVHGRYWSVPRSCIGKRARCVTAPGGRLAVYVGGELVAEHDTAAGGRVNYDPAHYAEALAGKGWALAEFDGDIARAAEEGLRLLGGAGGGAS